MTPALLAIRRFWPLWLALAAFYGGWVTHGWKDRSDRLDAVVTAFDARTEREMKANERSEAAEDARAALEKQTRTLNRRLTHETRADAYRCPLPADGLRLFNAARTGADPAAAGEPDVPVPAPGGGAAR